MRRIRLEIFAQTWVNEASRNRAVLVTTCVVVVEAAVVVCAVAVGLGEELSVGNVCWSDGRMVGRG